MRDEETARSRQSCFSELLTDSKRVSAAGHADSEHGAADDQRLGLQGQSDFIVASISDTPDTAVLMAVNTSTVSSYSASSASPTASTPFASSMSSPSSPSKHVLVTNSSPPASEAVLLRTQTQPQQSQPQPQLPHPILPSDIPPTASSPPASSSSSTSPPSPPYFSRPSDTAKYSKLSSFERWTVRASDSQFNALSGAVGGFTSGIVTCPLDVIKTKLQAQGGFANSVGQHRTYKGLVGTARTIWHDEGFRGMYRGLGPIILGYLPTWAVWFTVYNKSKVWMGERYQNNIVISFWSSLVAGASSTIVTNPIWVIKTRLMSQMPLARVGIATASSPTASTPSPPPWHYQSTIDAARKMYTTEGVLSFYSGLTPALLGLTHVAVQFPAYEYFKTKFTGQGMGDSGGKPDHRNGRGGERTSSDWLGVLSATILSKVLASSLTYPHEVIRTRLQTQRRPVSEAAAPQLQSGGSTSIGSGVASNVTAQQQPRYRGVIMTFRTILREEGWRAFYAGLGTNMMRAVPAATVTMLTYEYVMRMLKQSRQEARLKLQDLV